MKDKKQTEKKHPKVAPTPPEPGLFGRENYLWIIIGIVVVCIGILLMIGGKSDDPNVFNENQVYSFRRITLAPIVILLGLAMEVYAIFKKPKEQQ